MKMKKLLKFIFWPLIMLKNILDANWWANKIVDKTNMEEKIQGSRFNRWQNSLPQPYRFIFKTSMLIKRVVLKQKVENYNSGFVIYL